MGKLAKETQSKRKDELEQYLNSLLSQTRMVQESTCVCVVCVLCVCMCVCVCVLCVGVAVYVPSYVQESAELRAFFESLPPHTATYLPPHIATYLASSCTYVCVLILLYICPHTCRRAQS
jgi:hypothetical protein